MFKRYDLIICMYLNEFNIFFLKKNDFVFLFLGEVMVLIYILVRRFLKI